MGPNKVKRNRKLTIILLAIFCVSLIVSITTAIGEVVLWNIAAGSLILTFAHTWRRVKKFVILSGVSVIGIPVSILLHNLFYALAEVTAGVVVLHHLLNFLSVAFFFITLSVCPPGFIIGLVGSLVIYTKKRANPA